MSFEELALLKICCFFINLPVQFISISALPPSCLHVDNKSNCSIRNSDANVRESQSETLTGMANQLHHQIIPIFNFQILDLSYNYLQSVPYTLPCPFPSLQLLDLRQNFLENLEVNGTCIRGIRTINLSRFEFFTSTECQMDHLPN